MLFPRRGFLRQNALYFTLFGLLIAVGSSWVLLMPKGTLVLWFSGHRSLVGDQFFRLATRGGEVAGFLIALVILWRQSPKWPLALSVMTLAVSLVSNGTKTLFGQPRPARYFKEMGIWTDIVPVPGIKIHEGLTSLPSGHTMAAFAFFSLLAFCIRDKKLGAFLAFSLALLTGLSRIYLVQHFEEDVLLGATFGIALAIVFYQLFLQVPDEWWQRPRERFPVPNGE